MGSAFGYHLCNAPYRYRYFLWMHRISGWPDNPVAFVSGNGTDIRLDTGYKPDMLSVLQKAVGFL